jgi:flagellar assembly protein FliH
LSRVIKAADWQEKPLRIATPDPPKAPPLADAEGGLDEEAQQHMLAEIAAKEQRASQLLKDAQVQADILHQQAQDDYDQKLKAAQTEIDTAREKARQAGHNEGWQAGHDEGAQAVRQEMQQQVDEAAKKAEKTMHDASIASVDYVQQAEEEIVSIAMSVVDKVLPQHFIDAPQVILPLVKEALLKVRDQQSVIVHVAPASYDIVLLARDEFHNLLTGTDAKLEFAADETLQPGDCIIETPNGSVDARLATQLELIKNAVQEVMS